MEWNKKIRIANIIIFIICFLPIVLVNTISKGNFIAGPFLTILFLILLFVQFLIVLYNKKGSPLKIFFIVNIMILVFMYWMLFGYIFDLK